MTISNPQINGRNDDLRATCDVTDGFLLRVEPPDRDGLFQSHDDYWTILCDIFRNLIGQILKWVSINQRFMACSG
jgi:hypothetical protein